MIRKVTGATLILTIGALIWYLFFKDGEFGVRFKSKTLPGDIIQVAKIWNRSLENAEIWEVDSVEFMKQKIIVGKHEYLYEWYFELDNDSSTSVNIVISEKGNELKNKLLVPIAEPPIERDGSKLGQEFYDALKMHLKITGVKMDGLVQTPETLCACIGVETDQLDKARGMMNNYNYLLSFIENNSLEVTGKPIVDVLAWDHGKSRLTYDFCFPVKEPDSVTVHSDFHYKTIPSEKAVKAIYNGNYITSDRAWYYLLLYAQRNDLKIADPPMEVFYNNPNLGINEQDWKAEIFLPVQ